MPARPIPRRHWRSYGDHPLPTGPEALNEPLRAFPSWFLRIVCDRCGKEQLISEIYLIHGNMLIRDILERMRHASCGGRAGKGGIAHRHRGTRTAIRHFQRDIKAVTTGHLTADEATRLVTAR